MSPSCRFLIAEQGYYRGFHGIVAIVESQNLFVGFFDQRDHALLIDPSVPALADGSAGHFRGQLAIPMTTQAIGQNHANSFASAENLLAVILVSLSAANITVTCRTNHGILLSVNLLTGQDDSSVVVLMRQGFSLMSVSICSAASCAERSRQSSNSPLLSVL